MTLANYLFTSESVSEGHPDKVCDRISDAIVDAFLGADPEARVACETLATTNKVVIAGEVRGPASVTFDLLRDITRHAIKDIGYEQDGFHWKNADIEVLLHAQSVDIAQGVDAAGNKDEGAGDQGIMFGYACRETDVLMPAPIFFAHSILKSLAEARHSGASPQLGPDAKSQVTLRYENGKPVCATSVVVSTQHSQSVDQDEIRGIVRPHVLNVLPDGWMCDEAQFYVNPTGRFVIGGPDGDCGLTGRKIIVDTYGGAAPHGGGAFSGKDPTKVDRSAAYAARYLAKNVVAAGLADRCTIQLSYAIGVSRPLSVYIDTHETGRVDEARLSDILQQLVDLSPRGIRQHLGLNKPIYARTAAYGHFGRPSEPDGGFSWERTDLVEFSEDGARLTAPPIGRVYGRRRGRRMEGRKAELLDTVLDTVSIVAPEPPALLDPRTLFDPAPKAVWMEIGFGGGEHLAAQAELHPDIGFIGCEPFMNGVSNLLSLLNQGGQRNVRILKDDARLLLQTLPEGSIDRAFVLFPDPWPKRRHEDRRFLAIGGLDMLARVLSDGCELRVATDHAALGQWIEAGVAGHPAFRPVYRSRQRPETWPPTRYETKALAVGRQPVYLSYERVKRAL